MQRLRHAAELFAAGMIVAVCVGVPLLFVEPVRVAGRSMEPALAVGDVALVRRASNVRAGDIALIDTPGHGRVLHRVVDIAPSGEILTKGDANRVGDFTPTRERDVRGRVVGVVPVGTLAAWWRGAVSCATLSAQSDSARR